MTLQDIVGSMRWQKARLMARFPTESRDGHIDVNRGLRWAANSRAVAYMNVGAYLILRQAILNGPDAIRGPFHIKEGSMRLAGMPIVLRPDLREPVSIGVPARIRDYE